MDRRWLVREMPEWEKPTERMRSQGPRSLSIAELVGLILQTNHGVEIGQALQKDLAGIEELSEMNAAEIQARTAYRGFGRKGAERIEAAVELGRRIWVETSKNLDAIRSPEDVFKVLESDMRLLGTERAWVLSLDNRNVLLDKSVISMGSKDMTVIHPREVYRRAISVGASGVILAHNHPSGGLEPSSFDKDLTKKMVEVGKVVGIPCFDHVILSDNGYQSIVEWMKWEK